MDKFNDKYKIHWMGSIYQNSSYDTRICNYMKDLHSWYQHRKEKYKDTYNDCYRKKEIIVDSSRCSRDSKAETNSYLVMFEGHKEDLEKVLSSLGSD